MEGYLFFIIIILVILSIPYIRLFFKRLRIYIALKRKKKYILDTSLFTFFSAERVSKGFSLIHKETKERITVYTVFAHNKRETIEFTDTHYRIKKVIRMMGGRIGSGANFSWYTEYNILPSFFTEKKNGECYILFNPVPLSIKHNQKELYPDDMIFEARVMTGTKLLSKID